MRITHFVGIKIKDPLDSEINKIRKNLAKEEIIQLDPRYFPHITLYVDRFDNEDILLKNFNLKNKKFKVELSELNSFRDSILYLKVESDIIHKIHRTIVKKLQDLSEEKYFDEFMNENYKPHITLARFKKHHHNYGKEKFKKIKLPITLEIEEISLFKLDVKNQRWNEIKKITLEE
jgi:2'-5' RNA ligase|tara:strand:- start:598 stop:1125 length:528 start_codon:yes stop_codon:yes gene_type:complete